MKRLIIGCCLLVLMASCGGGQKKVDPFAALTEQIDSMKVLPDSIQDTTVTTVVEEQIPASADESFADFFYNFASDAKFQRSRVVFPFSLYKGKQVKRIQKEEWKHDPLFKRTGSMILYLVANRRTRCFSIRKRTWKWKRTPVYIAYRWTGFF